MLLIPLNFITLDAYASMALKYISYMPRTTAMEVFLCMQGCETAEYRV